MTSSLSKAATMAAITVEAEAFRMSAHRQRLQPFAADDTTAGMEYELQVAVVGDGSTVDLPLTIKGSSYFRNLVKRCLRGDCPDRVVDALRSVLTEHEQSAWENSWVRMKTGCLSAAAARVIEHDFLADKARPDGPLRSDRHRFFAVHRGEQWLRLPISYLLKLALADCLGRMDGLPTEIHATGEQLLTHFISDNTSPEILSLSVANSTSTTIGSAAAQESARTFLFAQLLLQYANIQFHLQQNGQRACLYFSPQVPLRQKRINDLVPDNFYRQLFMSPCLSGWDRGEEKHAHMELCHKTLSSSQLNAISKLREAGILSNNLVVLPNTSHTCLANNGIHISLGSRLLTKAASDRSSGFSPAVEKYYGDLVIKIIEHFLPLLVTTCSAAPYRVDFADFHPEKMLGFLPHELDYTHLRMLWRRWKKKADISVFGGSLTPFGPQPLDRLIAAITCSRGDLIPDFRLLDYLVALLSTETSPALDGSPGNQDLLKRDLAEIGVFDERMAIYLPCRLRDFSGKGFSGFEGRFYSLFPSLLDDIRIAVDTQNVLTALAYRYVLDGTIGHADIPDTPTCESERRQIFFAAAIGIPTVYIETATKNRLLTRILSTVEGRRSSSRYKGYTRITVHNYQRALLELLSTDGAALVESLQARKSLHLLHERLAEPNASAAHRLTSGILRSAGSRRTPLAVPAAHFNQASEQYYRNTLRLNHIREGISVFQEDCAQLEQAAPSKARAIGQALGITTSLSDYLQHLVPDLVQEALNPTGIRHLVAICLTVINQQVARKEA